MGWWPTGREEARWKGGRGLRPRPGWGVHLGHELSSGRRELYIWSMNRHESKEILPRHAVDELFGPRKRQLIAQIDNS